MSATCARCGESARGTAFINDDRYCHEGPEPTCYMQATWDQPRQRLESAAARAVQLVGDVLDGRGEHAHHERRQVGRCVYCSCGTRVQGRMRRARP